jgi:hypothetical protein
MACNILKHSSRWWFCCSQHPGRLLHTYTSLNEVMFCLCVFIMMIPSRLWVLVLGNVHLNLMHSWLSKWLEHIETVFPVMGLFSNYQGRMPHMYTSLNEVMFCLCVFIMVSSFSSEHAYQILALVLNGVYLDSIHKWINGLQHIETFFPVMVLLFSTPR